MKKTNNMKIAILGFGSILNYKNPKSKKAAKLSIGKWNKGPKIPLEMTRISKDNRLTMVIDEKAGKLNEAFYAISKHTTLGKAFDEIVAVEQISPNAIGVIDLRKKETSKAAAKHSGVTLEIAKWARNHKIDVVLWSGLGRKFKDKIDVKFTPENALDYITNLPAKERKLTVDYVKNLPENFDTPVINLVSKAKFGKK